MVGRDVYAEDDDYMDNLGMDEVDYVSGVRIPSKKLLSPTPLALPMPGATQPSKFEYLNSNQPSWHSDMEGIRQLFGDKKGEYHKIDQKFSGTLVTYGKGSEISYRDVYAWLQSIMNENGTPHPFDNRYIQVPAKMLMDKNGGIMFVVRDGVEIILTEKGENSGGVVINAFYKQDRPISSAH